MHEHNGTFLRIGLGPCYTSASTTMSGGDVSIHGAGAAIALAVGTTVARNTIIYGEILTALSVIPTLKAGPIAAPSTNDTTAGLAGLGPGVVHYFGSSNVYLSGTLLVARYDLTQDGRLVARTQFGPGISLMVGKEWWASPDWGLGVALQLLGASLKDNGDGGAPTWSFGGIAALFSASYN